MAVARQPQALNNFLRAVKSCKPTTYRSIRTPPSSRTGLHTTSQRAQTTYPNRYGPAATASLPPPPKPADSLTPKQGDSKAGDTQTKQSQPQQKIEQQQQQQQGQEAAPKTAEKNQAQEDVKTDPKESKEHAAAKNTTRSSLEGATVEAQARQVHTAQELQPEEQSPQSLEPDLEKPLGTPELDMILSIPAPSEMQSTGQNEGHRSRHPHLEPSPYEHHFDTYSLVRELATDADAFTEQQATTIMKAIRLMLTENLDLAKEGLISKSDIENESYLFRAACSELKTTLVTTRASENQRQRTQRASLQHELDILNQKVTQDVATMREDLKGMFNDRKMGLQEEKRKIDSKISELNYEITVLLNSEAKSEVEGLRWVLTRRAALAIAAAAFMILTSLQYTSIKSRETAEIEKKRAAAQKAQDDRIASESQMRYTMPNRSSGTQTDMKGYEDSLG